MQDLGGQNIEQQPLQAGVMTNRLVGLVDIGSNSIRLVIYRAGGRLPHPQFNERDVCRLGEGLKETGHLAEDRMDHALKTLSRFASIIHASALDRLDIFATEALRKAENAQDFIANAEAILKAQIRILSGEEEARLSGNGVLSGFMDVDGIVGDLGGGSLELAHIHSAQRLKQSDPDKKVVSLPLGHLQKLKKAEIAASLEQIDWLHEMKGKPFYAVGGTWRALATAYTSASKKRVDVVHGLTLSPDELKKLMDHINDPETGMEGVPPARRGSMKQAIKVMRVLLKHLEPEMVVFSSYGIREGILYEDLSRDIRDIDPLMAGVEEYGMMTERFTGLGIALSKQIAPFIKTLSPKIQRLAKACCYLADISWLDHPDYRAGLAIEKMLGLSVVGVTHADRALMAAVLSVRYRGSFPTRKVLRGLMTEKDRKSARYIGSILRLLMSVSGGIPSLIDQLEITAETRSITIGIPSTLSGIDQGLVDRRIQAISDYTSLTIKSHTL